MSQGKNDTADIAASDKNKRKKKKKKNPCSLENWTYISRNRAQPESLETTEKNGLS